MSSHISRRHALLVGAALFGAACSPAKSTGSRATVNEPRRLPTGATLDPAGAQVDVGSFPLTVVVSPDSAHLLLLLNGWRQQGVQVVDRRTGAVVQTAEQTAAFVGLVFSPDGRTVFASGGNTDAVYRYDWNGQRLTRRDSLTIRVKRNARVAGTSYPAGLAVSRDGKRLYVAENLADSIAVVDLASGDVVQRVAAGRYPYAVVVSASGDVFVSSWGTRDVHVLR